MCGQHFASPWIARLALLVFVMHIADIFAQPSACGPSGICDCRTSVISCSNLNLREIPRDIPENTTQLNLGSNRITSLTVERLGNLARLTELSLFDNSVSLIEDGVFSNMPHLNILVLQQNRLTSINATSLPPSATVIYLGRNPISSFSPEALRRATSLDHLSMGGTNLTCDCAARDLALVAAQSDIIIYGNCLNGTPFTELQDNVNLLCELQSVTEWVVYSVRNELGLTANISGFLESSYSMMKVDVVNNKQVCAQGNFNCYTYLTIAIRSSTELPTESDLRAALNSVPLKRGNSKHQLTAVLFVEAWCGDDALNVSLGYPQLFPCEIQTSRQQRFTRHCVLANGDVAWSEGDKSNCPTENTGTLESILDSLHNNSGTVSGTSTSVEAVNKILATPDSLGALDVTLVSEIINGSLDAAPPSMNTAASYVTSFNQLAGLNEETLRVANRNSRTAQRLIDTIDRFNNDFDLLNSTSWNSTDTQIHIEIAEPLPDRKYTISFNEVNVEIPPQAIANADRPRVKFIVFKSSNLFEALREESSRKNETLFSWVVSAAIGNQPIKELENSVKLRLPHSRNLASNESTVCQYWDWHLNGWSTAGVETRRESENITVCETSHLTNFALLLDVNPYDDPTISLQHAQILSVISYAGCALSVLSLITTLFIYIAFKKVRKSNPSKILMNLCAALLLLNGVFLGLTHFKDDPIVCKITAVLLHYSLLASFSWMAVEAFYMYIALILVFSYIKHFMLKVLIVGWGVPAVIVGITLAISPDNYAIYQDQLCWLQPNAFFGAVLVPICIVIVMNFIVFGLVIRQLCASRFKGNALYKYADKKTLQKRNKVSSQLRGAVSIFFLLGLTWTFAAFLLIEHNIVFNYLFAIFNSLQGFFLFLFYCVFKREVSVECMKCCICCEYDPNDATISSFNKSTSGTTNTHGRADRIFRRTTSTSIVTSTLERNSLLRRMSPSPTISFSKPIGREITRL